MKRPRDSQRQRVYDAEKLIPDFSSGHRLETMEEIEAYVAMMLSHEWFRRHFRSIGDHIDVSDGRGSRRAKAFCTQNRMSFPKWARSRMNVIHEVTHMVVSDAVSAHGWQFCATYLDLTRHFMGEERYKQLREAFRTKKVRYKQPKTVKNGARPGNVAALMAWKAKKAAERVAAGSNPSVPEAIPGVG